MKKAKRTPARLQRQIKTEGERKTRRRARIRDRDERIIEAGRTAASHFNLGMVRLIRFELSESIGRYHAPVPVWRKAMRRLGRRVLAEQAGDPPPECSDLRRMRRRSGAMCAQIVRRMGLFDPSLRHFAEPRDLKK